MHYFQLVHLKLLKIRDPLIQWIKCWNHSTIKTSHANMRLTLMLNHANFRRELKEDRVHRTRYLEVCLPLHRRQLVMMCMGLHHNWHQWEQLPKVKDHTAAMLVILTVSVLFIEKLQTTAILENSKAFSKKKKTKEWQELENFLTIKIKWLLSRKILNFKSDLNKITNKQSSKDLKST